MQLRRIAAGAGWIFAAVLGAHTEARAGTAGEVATPRAAAGGDGVELRTFSVRAGPAGQTLKRFSAQAGVPLLYAADQIEGVITQAIRGRFTVHAALAQMLQGSPLTAEREERSGAWTIVRRAVLPPAASPRQRRDAPPAGTPDRPIALSPFEVTTDRDEGYRANNSASGNKVNTPIRETPQSIQIVNRSFIDDLQARSLADALLYTSGITEGQNPRGDRFEIRGFTTGIPFKNGFRDTARAPRELANFDRIEVAKGPASVIFSRTSAGGAVNILTKLPQPRPFGELSATIGSHDYVRGAFDVNAPLAPNVLFRINAAAEDSGSFRAHGFVRRQFVAPILSWMAGPRSRLNLELEYLRDRRVNDAGLVALGGAPVPVSARTSYGDPEDVNRTEQFAGRYEWLHTFTSGWSLRQAGRVNQTNERGYDTRFDAVDPVAGILHRSRRHLVAEGVDNVYVQTEFSREVVVLGGRHVLLGGFEVGYNFDGGVTDAAPLTPANLFAPDRGTTGGFVNERWFDSTTWVREYFVQDQVYVLRDTLALLAGARLASFEEFATDKRTDTEVVRREDAPNPRFGAVWMPRDDWSLFVNHSRLVFPQTGVNPDGSLLPPTKTRLTEIGARVDVLDGRITATAALYDLRLLQVTNPDPERPGFSVATGEQRTRGIEFDLVGRPLACWQVIGSVNISDAQVTQHTGALLGNRRPNTPSHSYSLWNRVDAAAGARRGWAVAAGVVRVSGRFGDIANSYYVPPHVRVDAALSYRWPGWDLAWNVQNLTDTSFVRAVNGRLSIRLGSPREFSLRVRRRY